VATALEKFIQESNLDPATCVLRHVTRASRLIVATFDAAFAPVGLTGHQFNLLMTLARLGPMNVNSLAGAVGMHPSTTPRLIAPLARGRLVRTQSGTDRRVRVMAITRKGRARLARAFPRWAELQKKMLSHLGTEEWSSAMASLKKIRVLLRQSPGNR
jgi:DNA-binding MarR family transcriptional regulator